MLFPVRLSVATAALVLCPSFGSAAPLYAIADLGPVAAYPSAQTIAFAVNDNGTVVGKVTSPTQWLPAQWVNHAPGSISASVGAAVDVNSGGHIAGVVDDRLNRQVAFVWDSVGGLRTLGTLPGGDHSGANGINDAGWVVGYSVSGGRSTAFLWDSTQMTPLPSRPGANDSSANAINNGGVITGASGFQAVLWTSGSVTPLGYLVGDTFSSGHDINLDGWVVGYSDDNTGVSEEAVLWDGSSVVGLGYLAGDFRSVARGINDRGWIVGESMTLNSSRAVLWEGGHAYDLATLIAGPNPFSVLASAYEVSNSGYITGYGDVNGRTHGFLLTPVAVQVPEPPAVMLALGLILTAFARRRASNAHE